MLRTGIELYVIISEIRCLQADLQADMHFLVFYALFDGIMIKQS